MLPPQDLLTTQTRVYIPCGLPISELSCKEESQEYGACTFLLEHRRVLFRTAKITPKKSGQFVTLWKRIGTGPISPYDLHDPFDFFVVSVKTSTRFGQFIFPKTKLCQKEIVSSENREGKRAMRVYPPWDVAPNTQAKKTQAWQLPYFLEIPRDTPCDISRVRNLFH